MDFSKVVEQLMVVAAWNKDEREGLHKRRTSENTSKKNVYNETRSNPNDDIDDEVDDE